MSASLAEVWGAFLSELETRNQRLLTELTAAWMDIDALTQTLSQALGDFDAQTAPPLKIESHQSLYSEVGRRLLAEPVSVFLKKRPLVRALAALRDYDSALDDLVRALPSEATVPVLEFAEIAGLKVGGWRKQWLGLKKSTSPVNLRAVLTTLLQRQLLRRSRLDGGLQLMLAQLSLHLPLAWQLCRRYGLSLLSGRSPDPDHWQAERGWWVQNAQKHAAKVVRLLEDYRHWVSQTPVQIASAVLRRAREVPAQKLSRMAEQRQHYVSYWSRQQRAVHSVLELERALLETAVSAAKEAAWTRDALDDEHAGLLQELDSVIDWLESWNSERKAESFPPPQAKLVSADERLNDWVRRVSANARALLPTAVEVVAPRNALPAWTNPWRKLEPEKTFQDALSRTGSEVALEGFREVEASHKALVREIERAREVVTFSYESAEAEPAEGMHILQEAVANALSLLHYQKRAAPDPGPTAEKSLTRALALTLLQTHVALEEGRLGLLAYLGRQTGVRRMEQLSSLALEIERTAVRKGSRAIREAYRRSLVAAGWIAPQPAPPAPVLQTSTLGQILETEFGVRDLPALYRRLFRLAPVEDPRFLVGRDQELAGLADALSQWESGRYAAVIIVGARGSGKTSILNCAAATIFSLLPVVRGQFCQRITSAPELEQFLCSLFQCSDKNELQSVLAQKRRVVMLEEMERTFLRKINGFDGLRRFLGLISSTWRTTLWILSINETSFRYLNAVFPLRQSFSHQVNAMSVSPEDMSNAVLQRHYLSGLRVEFTPPPEQDPRVGRLRRFLGLVDDPQELFFDGLYHQAEGIFRAAFELWQDCIERIEGGVVRMRQPLAPDYRPLLQELTMEDLFLLQAVLQHGGLNAEEVSECLGIDPQDSRRRLERLTNLEILEAEPLHPGLRIRPQAGRFVRDALHSQNLL